MFLLSIPGVSFLRSVCARLLVVKSARGVSFTLSALALLSKPLGYLRTLIIAWAFGTAPGMDAYQLASGIIGLFAGSIGTAMQSAVLPEVERLRQQGSVESSRSLVAFVAWAVLLVAAFFCAALMIGPGVLIRFFAGGFDDERIGMGAMMLWWLIPYAVVIMVKPVVDIWALCLERYTLSAVCGMVFNFIAIPVILLAIPVLSVYSVAAGMSAGNVVSFLLFLFFLGGLPLVWRRGSLLFDSLFRVGRNTLFALIVVGGGSLYVIFDRYFASRLPVGSVAAISYGATIVSFLSLIAVTPMTYFLARVSRVVATDHSEAKGLVQQAMALVSAYFVPISLFVSAASTPIVSFLYGWGNFDARSVAMTSTALSAYCVGMTFSLCGLVVHRYALALQRMGAIVTMTYIFVILNAFLNWLLVGRWGIAGLAWATSITQIVSFILYYLVVVGDSLIGFLIGTRFLYQFAFASILAFLAFLSGALGFWAQSAITVLLALLYLFAAERFGLMPLVPPHWRPTGLVLYLLAICRPAGRS